MEISKQPGQDVNQQVDVQSPTKFFYSGNGNAVIKFAGVQVTLLDSINSVYKADVPGEYSVIMTSGNCSQGTVTVVSMFQQPITSVFQQNYTSQGSSEVLVGFAVVSYDPETGLSLLMYDTSGTELSLSSISLVSN